MVALCLLSAVLKLPARPHWSSVTRAEPAHRELTLLGAISPGPREGQPSWPLSAWVHTSQLWSFYTTWQASYCAMVFN